MYDICARCTYGSGPRIDKESGTVIVVTRSIGPAALTMTEVGMLTRLPVLKILPSPISWTS